MREYIGKGHWGKSLWFVVVLCILNYDAGAATFYLSDANGNDSNTGLSVESPWKTIDKINKEFVNPGDSILFYSGGLYKGSLLFSEEGGDESQPIVVSSYGSGSLPIIDGDGYLATIDIINSGYIHISNLEIKNDNSQSKPGVSTKLRYGLYIQNTIGGGVVFEGYRLDNVTFRNIYPTDQITDDDQTGINAYAIRTTTSAFVDEFPTRFNDFIIENCLFTRIGRHAILLTATNNLTIRNNLFEHVGGAGMVIGSNSSNILVEHNVTNYTGSNLDPRMAARGSGLWCYRTKNLTAQYNRFMHARGFKDSFGMHIDIGNRNVVYQYNYSEDNEGGFVEVLGGNRNVGYRYNVSIGDGWRVRGPQLGRMFWVGGWSGRVNQPLSSDSVFIYNNSVYIPETIEPRIWIEGVTRHTRIYNNAVYVAGKFDDVFIKNDASYNDFDNNIWFGDISTSDTDGEEYRGVSSLDKDPMFESVPVVNSDDFILQPNSPALGKGKLISNPNAEGPYDYYSKHGGRDFYGNVVSCTEAPNIGAYNGGFTTVTSENNDKSFKLSPNPVRSGQQLEIELPLNMQAHQLSIQIADHMGIVVMQKMMSKSPTINLPLKGLASGCYNMLIQGKGYHKVQQFILLH